MIRILPAAILIFLPLLGGCFGPPIRVVTLPPSAMTNHARVPRGYGVVHAMPRYRHGHRDGVVVGGIVRGSLADAMGLRPGDVIVEMAGIPCNGLRACRRGARRLERALRRRQPFALVLERRGRFLELRFRHSVYRPINL